MKLKTAKLFNETTNINERRPMMNRYYLSSELNDVLQSGCYKSPLGYNNIGWYIDEVIKLEKEKAVYFKNTKKVIIMKEEDEEDYRNNNICRFCEREVLSDKVRYHCHLTGKNRGAAHNNCNKNVTQKQTIFIPFTSYSFSNYDYHLFFKNSVDEKSDKANFKNLHKANEEYI